MRSADSLLLAGFVTALVLTPGSAQEFRLFKGMCDASSAVALSTNLVALADDEDNFLRVYPIEGGRPIFTLNMSPFLQLTWKAPEGDFEAGTRVGDRVYWISSHGRDAEGRERRNRHQFFATTLSLRGSQATLAPLGKSYHNLLQDLVREPRLKQFNLLRASRLPPKEPGALNLEGLAATSTGEILLGFRNPIPDGKALIVPVRNPEKLVSSDSSHAEFGEPILLDLGGEGIRGMDNFGNRLLIVGGSPGSGGKSTLFAWSFGSPDPPRPITEHALHKLNPEAVTFLAADDQSARAFAASDDGNRLIAGNPCKRLKDPNLKQFRGVTVQVNVPELSALKSR